MGAFLMEAAFETLCIERRPICTNRTFASRPPGNVGPNSDKGNRLFVEAVIWKFRTGAPWLGSNDDRPYFFSRLVNSAKFARKIVTHS
jgi:hypothetical protein